MCQYLPASLMGHNDAVLPTGVTFIHTCSRYARKGLSKEESKKGVIKGCLLPQSLPRRVARADEYRLIEKLVHAWNEFCKINSLSDASTTSQHYRKGKQPLNHEPSMLCLCSQSFSSIQLFSTGLMIKPSVSRCLLNCYWLRTEANGKHRGSLARCGAGNSVLR